MIGQQIPLLLLPLCAGCSKDIKSAVVGYNQNEDFQYCLARHMAYYFRNKLGKSYKLTSGARHCHINPLCTKSHQSLTKKISQGDDEMPRELLKLLKDRFPDFTVAV